MKKRVSLPKHHDLAAASLTVSSPVVGAPTLTVGQIAEQLRAIAPDTSATIERIRHWTRENLLSPVDQHHAGTGKHRLYTEESSYNSAILTVIANAGLSVVAQSYLPSALALTRSALLKWKRARKKDRHLAFFLEISQSPNGNPTVSIHEDAVKHDPTAALSITINLSQIFTRVLQESTQASNLKRPNSSAKRLPNP